jgi:thiaminase
MYIYLHNFARPIEITVSKTKSQTELSGVSNSAQTTT